MFRKLKVIKVSMGLPKSNTQQLVILIFSEWNFFKQLERIGYFVMFQKLYLVELYIKQLAFEAWKVQLLRPRGKTKR